MYPTPKATKVGTGGPHPLSGNYHDIEPLVKMVENARKQVGPDGAIMFDAHCAVPPPLLIQFAAAIEPYDVLWIEEPAVPGNIEVFKRLKQQIRIPIATGERDRTIWDSDRRTCRSAASTSCSPTCGQTGGISQMKKIAALAEAYFVPLAPHNTCSELGLSASLHAVGVDAAVPDPGRLPRRPHHAAGRGAQELGRWTRTATPRCRRGRAWASRSTRPCSRR